MKYTKGKKKPWLNTKHYTDADVNRHDFIKISNNAQLKLIKDFKIKPRFLIHKFRPSKKIHIWDLGDTWCNSVKSGGVYLADWDILEDELNPSQMEIGLCKNCINQILKANMEHLYENHI